MSFRWTHRDPAFAASVARGHARAAARDWSGNDADALRALAAHALLTAHAVGGHAIDSHLSEAGTTIELVAEIDLTTDPVRAAHQRAILSPFEILAGAAYPEPRGAFTTTTGSGAATHDAGFAPLALAIVVVGGVALGGAAAYGLVVVAEKALEVIDRKLTRDTSARELMAAHAQHVALLDAHADAERVAGRNLPFTSAEELARQAAASRIAAAQQSSTAMAPLTTDSVPSLGAAAGGFGMGALAVGAAALFFLSRRG